MIYLWDLYDVGQCEDMSENEWQAVMRSERKKRSHLNSSGKLLAEVYPFDILDSDDQIIGDYYKEEM